MLVTYMRRMRNDNLEIRIAGSFCRPQLSLYLFSGAPNENIVQNHLNIAC